ncbi:MAG: hypothetical protein Q8L45_03795 [Xanthomonadaceae bacterium]|nr:hypothetical protein [Xanthomonadaceae bacterium]MDP2186519.1 hypothetical protein [Xanthomonadales bacterium]MDZ4117084.1 hypothetical protein [Xanthomonadaceae bacterium]MDZ4379265.1 hypothetical protein [Xanthomonadaceae bacterium]
MRKLSVVLVVIVLALAGCASESKKSKSLDAVLYAYAGAVRWGEFERAWEMVDPEVRKEHPLSNLEWSRFAQVQITGYKVQASGPTADGDIEQFVQIGVVSRLSQAERVVVTKERWRWDDEAKRWWLVSGFPDISASR